MESVYTPDGAFAFLLVVLALTLVAAVGYLVLFTNASFLP